jgi:serine protease Do
MSWRAALLALLLAGAGAAFAQTTAPAADPLETYRLQEEVFRQAAQRVAPCVVTIETIGGTQPTAAMPQMPGPPRMPGEPPGRRGPRRPRPNAPPGFIVADGPTTGLIWSSDGLILTSAFNFVRDPSVITVVLPDGRRLVGELLARDEVRRLAMVKIQATGLPVPEWVQSPPDVKVGQWVLALGRGFGGKEPSVSAGIISGLNRKGGVAVQTDAKLSPANFGGPLIDIQGRVIGLNVPMGMGNSALAGVEWYDSGIGFAVPSWQTGKSAESLALGHNLRRGLLGVLIDAQAKGIVRISNLAERSPAARAGLAVNDVIVGLDGKPVGEYADLQRLMSAKLAGEKVTLRIKRGKDEMDIPVVLGVPEDMGELPAQEPESGPAETQPAESRPHGD